MGIAHMKVTGRLDSLGFLILLDDCFVGHFQIYSPSAVSVDVNTGKVDWNVIVV